MTQPKRIQRRRTKGWRLPENTVVVTRGTHWGNPYRVGEDAATAEQVVELYRKNIAYELEANPDLCEPLRGKNLCCWCAEGSPCHADVLLELANK